MAPSSKKHVRYFLVANHKEVMYIKLESDLPFLVREGETQLKSSYPSAKITHLAKEKAKKFLELF